MYPEDKVKRVLFIGGNFYPELIGVGKYNGEMIEYLADHGYHCTVLTSYPYYPFWKVQPPYDKQRYFFKKEIWKTLNVSSHPVEIYRCPLYIPQIPSGKNRILQDFSFCCTSLIKLVHLLFKKKYDYVITVAPSFQIGLLGLIYKWIRGCRFLYHIQDLQIDAAYELNMIKSKFLVQLMFSIERFILKSADIVSSISSGMIRKIHQKCPKEVVLFPNWVDTEFFYPIGDKAKLKEEFRFSLNDKIILYSGAIGEKQGLEDVLNVVKDLKDINDLKFIICGSGPYKEKLICLASELKLDNLYFFQLQPKERLNRFLNMADVHLVLQKEQASDLVMPSKLASILSVGGLVIVAASEGSNLYDVVAKNKMGITIPSGDRSALSQAVRSSLVNSYEEERKHARAYAEEFLSIDSAFQSYLPHLQ